MFSHIPKSMLILAALIAFGNALAHMACIVLGPQCFEFQMAPQFIIDSSIQGTWQAPMGTVMVSSIFALWGAYALAGAKVIAPLPLMKWGIYAIGFLCVVRGLLGIQLWIRHPELLDTKSISYSIGWFVTGLLYGIGYWKMGREEK